MMSFSIGMYSCLFMGVLFLNSMVIVDGSRMPLHHLLDTSLSLQEKEGSKFSQRGHKNHEEVGAKEELGMEMYPKGSTLPDCSHACGPCSPCKRVMVSFKCSVAESCPVVYRCMCRGKYYHVPSNV